MKDLLLLLSRYPYEEKNRETLSKLLREVKDWNQTSRLINAHGIIALAAYNIKEAGLEKELPQETMAFLENGYRQNVVRNIWLTERWKEVNEILGKAGIKHILLKGMALEHTVYGARGLRQMNDNDILIRKEEAVEAWHLLQKEGFTYKTPKSPLHLKIMTEISNHLPALTRDGYSLEVHTVLFDFKTRKQMAPFDFFKNNAEINVDDKKALILHREIHLNYLISHFERHARSGESQIRSYADILLFDTEMAPEFQERFIMHPDQKGLTEFQKAGYKAKTGFVAPRYRILFLAGDLFPSLQWMKERYNCSGVKTLLYYPHRWGKLWWLL